MLKRLITLVATIFAIFVVSAGCTSLQPRMMVSQEVRYSPMSTKVFHADTAFDARDRKLLDEVANMIRVQTSGLLEVKFVYDLDFSSTSSIVSLGLTSDVLIKTTSLAPYIMSEETDGKMTLGFATVDVDEVDMLKPVRVYVVSDRLTNDLVFKHVVMHELLHAFRLRHVDDWRAIMSPAVHVDDLSQCMGEADAQELCRVYLCNPLRLNYCK